MRRIVWGSAAAFAALMAVGVVQMSAAGNDGEGQGPVCNDTTIRGDYGVQIQGTRPAPGGLTESVVGVVLRTYDGHGNIDQVDNVKGSITGITFDRPGFGTYEVHEDCTGIARFQPGPGIVIEERMVIVNKGREIRTITGSPAGVMVTGVHLRVR